MNKKAETKQTKKVKIVKATKERGANEFGQALLSPNDHWQLSRLSIAALKMLSDKADELTDWSYKYHTPEGRAENGGDNYD